MSIPSHARLLPNCPAFIPCSLFNGPFSIFYESDGMLDLVPCREVRWSEMFDWRSCIAKAAGEVRPIGLLFAIVRVQCGLRRIEAKVWEASNTEGLFLWATHARGVERCVWE